MGRGIAQALAQGGATIAIGYAHSQSDADETAAFLRQQGGSATTHRADVGRVADCDALVQAVLENHQRVDILVNAAGTTRHVPFEDLASITEEVWDDLFDVNLKGPFFISRAAGQWMREHGDGNGTILNIASISSFLARGSSIPYSVSKSAVVHLTKCLAAALAPKVRVNAIAPGLVLTRWWTSLGPDVVEKQIQGTLFKREVAFQDVIDAAMLAICSDSMSGQTITIDLANVMH